MLTAYLPSGQTLATMSIADGADVPESAIWIDLRMPVDGEDRKVEKLIGVAVPTREEMQEIEVSSRLYIEDGARFMTAVLMAGADTPTPRIAPVTFILAAHRLITVRYDDPRPFSIVANKLARGCAPDLNGEAILLDLLEAVIDRGADILERIGADVDQVSHDIFESAGKRTGHPKRYGDILIAIGRKGDLTSKVRESLLSIQRLILFIANESEGLRWSKDMRAELKTMQRDVTALSDHANYLANKITFVLDAMLGVVNLEQNNIIKLFSVMAVVLMPPTLIASIYGMNFRHMPELDWTIGYPLVLVLMIFAAVLPYLYFKWKKWL